MLFNNPIARKTQPTYSEGTALASVRDNRNTSLLWKKARPTTHQTLQDNISLSGLVQKLNRIGRRQIGYPNTSPSALQAFSIYNVGGNTFQIRDGIVEYRSAYFVNFVTGNGGNFSKALYCPNTDYSANAGYSINPAGLVNGVNFDRTQENNGNPVTVTTSATLISDSSATMPMANQITMATPDFGAGMFFWLNIIDDPIKGFYVQLFAQVADFTVFDFAVYPAGNNIIPIGFVVWNGGGFDIQQYQYGNLVQAYRDLAPIYSGTPLASGNWDYPQVMRGNWSEIIGNVGGGVFGLFYPGDLVIDDLNFVTFQDPLTMSNHNMQSTYICTNPVPFITTTSPFDAFTADGFAGGWVPVSSVIVS